jgi:hypothetical protein
MQSFANADVKMLRLLSICNLSIVQRLCGSLNKIPDPETRSIVTLKRAQLPTEPTRLAPSTSCLAGTHITCTTWSPPAKLLQHNQRQHLSQRKNLFNFKKSQLHFKAKECQQTVAFQLNIITQECITKPIMKMRQVTGNVLKRNDHMSCNCTCVERKEGEGARISLSRN